MGNFNSDLSKKIIDDITSVFTKSAEPADKGHKDIFSVIYKYLKGKSEQEQLDIICGLIEYKKSLSYIKQGAASFALNAALKLKSTPEPEKQLIRALQSSKSIEQAAQEILKIIIKNSVEANPDQPITDESVHIIDLNLNPIEAYEETIIELLQYSSLVLSELSQAPSERQLVENIVGKLNDAMTKYSLVNVNDLLQYTSQVIEVASSIQAKNAINNTDSAAAESFAKKNLSYANRVVNALSNFISILIKMKKSVKQYFSAGSDTSNNSRSEVKNNKQSEHDDRKALLKKNLLLWVEKNKVPVDAFKSLQSILSSKPMKY